jgi:hypothetical protein
MCFWIADSSLCGGFVISVRVVRMTVQNWDGQSAREASFIFEGSVHQLTWQRAQLGHWAKKKIFPAMLPPSRLVDTWVIQEAQNIAQHRGRRIDIYLHYRSRKACRRYARPWRDDKFDNSLNGRRSDGTTRVPWVADQVHRPSRRSFPRRCFPGDFLTGVTLGRDYVIGTVDGSIC